MSTPRVLLITNIPTPYRIPLFNELNAQLAAQGIGFQVIFAALAYPRRKWAIDMTQCAFSWRVLNSRRLPSRDPESAVFTYSGLGRILDAEPGALVLVGGFSLATMRIWLRSFYRKTRYIIWSGAIERKDRPGSRLQCLQRRRLVACARGFVAYGTRARDYLISMGAAPSKVSIGINTVDTHFFRSVATERIQSAGKVSEFIYVGELSQRKRVDLLLPIVAQLSEKRTDFILRVVGTGPEEVKLRGMAEQLGVSNRVSFEGFKQKPEVAKMLANADCFVFPTGFDIWGLVLVEAMAAGLPCISSLHAGVTHDLIQDGVTGFGVDFSQTGKVAEILGWVLEHPEESRAMGERARQFIADQVNLQKSAMGFVEAIRIALGRPQELNAETRRRANEALDMASCIRKERLLETNVDGYPKYRFGCPL